MVHSICQITCEHMDECSEVYGIITLILKKTYIHINAHCFDLYLLSMAYPKGVYFRPLHFSNSHWWSPYLFEIFFSYFTCWRHNTFNIHVLLLSCEGNLLQISFPFCLYFNNALQYCSSKLDNSLGFLSAPSGGHCLLQLLTVYCIYKYWEKEQS